jgi:hypothetical protein
MHHGAKFKPAPRRDRITRQRGSTRLMGGRLTGEPRRTYAPNMP